MLFLSCFLTLLGQITKAAAFKHQENTKLQKLTFLQNVWMFGADLFILGVTFSGMQLTGFSLLVLFYITEGTYNVVERRMANKKEFVANDEEYQRLWIDKKSTINGPEPDQNASRIYASECK